MNNAERLWRSDVSLTLLLNDRSAPGAGAHRARDPQALRLVLPVLLPRPGRELSGEDLADPCRALATCVKTFWLRAAASASVTTASRSRARTSRVQFAMNAVSACASYHRARRPGPAASAGWSVRPSSVRPSDRSSRWVHRAAPSSWHVSWLPGASGRRVAMPDPVQRRALESDRGTRKRHLRHPPGGTADPCLDLDRRGSGAGTSESRKRKGRCRAPPPVFRRVLLVRDLVMSHKSRQHTAACQSRSGGNCVGALRDHLIPPIQTPSTALRTCFPPQGTRKGGRPSDLLPLDGPRRGRIEEGVIR
jgi:hypothetical protein